jgi:hypothetical protein
MVHTPDSAETAQDDAREGGIRMLAELEEIGRNIARDLRKLALARAGGNPALVSSDDARAFARIDHAVRQTEAMRRRLEREQKARAARAEAERLERRLRADGYAGLRPTIH